MNCTACEYFVDGKCMTVKIYASGYCEECRFYQTEEPIISPSGCNLQVMGERIRADGYERVDLMPIKGRDKSEWSCQIMVCYNGKGRIRVSTMKQRLPGVAIWYAWKEALQMIFELDHDGLNKLILPIERRIQFEYSMIEYIPFKYKVEQEKSQPVKMRKIIIPQRTEHLKDVNVQVNDSKETGDQLDLFAV